MTSSYFAIQFLLSLLISGAFSQIEPQCSLPGECIDGVLLNEVDANSEKSCLRKCQNWDDCKWYTYDPTLEDCLLFESCSTVSDDDCQSCLSGEVNCEAFKCGEKGLCQGQLTHRELEVQSEYLCLALCKFYEGNCTWYTYNENKKTCFVMETCPSLNEGCADCTSGEQGCSLAGPKLLIVTGDPEAQADKTEVIDVDDPNFVCNSPGYYPLEGYGAAGAHISNNVSLVCGGYKYDASSAYDVRNECYSLDDSGEWYKIGTMRERRRNHAITIWDTNTVWITGGESNSFNAMSSTELVSVSPSGSGFSSVKAPDLPFAINNHCMIQLNSSWAIQIGGEDREGNTYFMDLNYETEQDVLEYQDGPALLEPRDNHVCGLLTRPGDGSDQVVVAAGGSYSGLKSSSELWTVGSDKWIRGPNMPKAKRNGAGATTPDGKSLLFIGGNDGSHNSGHIYKLSYQTGSGSWSWSKIEQELQVGRVDLVAMFIPDSMVNCSDTSP